jgi:S-adenosylhomocysteine hydrolase
MAIMVSRGHETKIMKCNESKQFKWARELTEDESRSDYCVQVSDKEIRNKVQAKTIKDYNIQVLTVTL